MNWNGSTHLCIYFSLLNQIGDYLTNFGRRLKKCSYRLIGFKVVLQQLSKSAQECHAVRTRGKDQSNFCFRNASNFRQQIVNELNRPKCANCLWLAGHQEGYKVLHNLPAGRDDNGSGGHGSRVRVHDSDDPLSSLPSVIGDLEVHLDLRRASDALVWLIDWLIMTHWPTIVLSAAVKKLCKVENNKFFRLMSLTRSIHLMKCIMSN